jgi:sec-independent protein translocase protein TatA
MELGAPELLIILVIVVLLFGVGRVGQIGGELGRGIREFRRGLAGDDAPPSNTSSSGTPSADDHSTGGVPSSGAPSA